MTGDAEDKDLYQCENVIKLFLGYRQFCIVSGCKMGVFKLHTNEKNTTLVCISILFSVFDCVEIHRSRFSLRSNTEIYLICKNPLLIFLPVSYTLKGDIMTISPSIKDQDCQKIRERLTSLKRKTTIDKTFEMDIQGHARIITDTLLCQYTNKDIQQPNVHSLPLVACRE